jgi:SpoVK/Ycf46/Vps4 family AAA+-type ATPase
MLQSARSPRRSTLPSHLASLRPAQIRAGWAMSALARAHPELVLARCDSEDLWRTIVPVLSWTPDEAANLARVVQRHPTRFLEDGSLANLPWDDPQELAKRLTRAGRIGPRRRRRLTQPVDLGVAYTKLFESDPEAVEAQLGRCFVELDRARRLLDDPVRRNLGHFQALVGWDETILAVLEVASAAADCEAFGSALQQISAWGSPIAAELVGTALDLDRATLQDALEPDSVIARCGILEPAYHVTDLKDVFTLGKTGRRLLWARAERPADLMRYLMRELAPGELTRNDFAHVDEDFELLLQAMRGALERQVPGINVLIYGPPGTGKSEFARLLACTAADTVLEVKLDDDKGDEPSRTERLQALMLGQRMLASAPRTVLLMEEAEDIFPHNSASLFASLFGMGPVRSTVGSKGWVNRQLETNPIPVIWISNSVRQMDPAFLRRFTYHLAIDQLPRSARAAIAAKHVAAVDGSAALVDQLAADPALTPAGVASAVRFAHLIGAEEVAVRDAHVRRQIEGFRKAVGQPLLKPVGPDALPYSEELLNVRCTHRLDQIVGALERRGRGTLCFHGAPGTGKTALAAHLAERTGRRLQKTTAGDLLSPYVGETEQAIAQLFRQHADRETVLLIDEAEGLLYSRAHARRSWELTQTNEFLRRVEEFEGILVVATNLVDALDEAFMRRFQFKVEFLALRPDQRTTLFRQALETDALGEDANRRLARLGQLTLGDFANAHRQFALIGEKPTEASFLAALEAEHAAKRAARRGGIGFTTGD